MSELRYIHLRGAAVGSQVRTARYEDRDWVVMPVVALVGDIVVRPMHSKGPEFVPAEELQKVPEEFNGRPVVPDHPDNGKSTANSPRVLEKMGYGTLFNTEYSNDRLKTEAWLDPEKAARVGGDAVRVLEVAQRALAGEDVDPVEVSVGVYVALVPEDGIAPGGDRYEYRWADIRSDHLAIGLNGSEGACSVEAGCGAPRSAKAESEPATAPLMRCATDDELEVSDMAKKPEQKSAAEGIGDVNLKELLEDAIRPLESGAKWIWIEAVFDDVVVYNVSSDGGDQTYQREYSLDAAAEAVTIGDTRIRVRRRITYEEAPTPVAAKKSVLPDALIKALEAMGFKSSQDDGTSDVDLRDAMWSALNKTVPGFRDIMEIFPDANTVIYAASPEEAVQFWSQSYAVDSDGVVSLGSGDPQQVKVEKSWKPVGAASGSTTEEVTATEEETEETKGAAAEGGCPCSETKGKGLAAQTPDTQEEVTMSDKLQDLAGRLIANADGPFTEESREALVALGESTLEAMLGTCQETVTEVDDVAAVTTEPVGVTDPAPETVEEVAQEVVESQDTVTLTKEEHASMLAASSAYQRHQDAHKAVLVASLKSAQKTYSEERLNLMEIAQLEELVELVGVEDVPEPDYGGRGMPRAASSTTIEPPKPYTRALEALRGDKEAN